MIETKEGFILTYLVVFILCFYIGNLTSARKRGRYLEQSISDIMPYLTFKIGFAIVTVILFLYLCFLEKKEISIELFNILSFALILLIVAVLLLVKKIKNPIHYFFNKEKEIDKKSYFKDTDENTDDEGTEDEDTDNDLDSNEKKDMIAIMEVAVCNGLLFIEILIIVASIICLSYSVNFKSIINMVKSFGIGNCYLLMLFNSILLLIFSCANFKYFFTRDKRTKDLPEDPMNIINFIKSDVDN